MFFAVCCGITLSYALLVTSVLVYLHHDGLSDVRWIDVALPSRWSSVRNARGNQHIITAHAFARSGRLSEALAFVRSGVAKSPANREGRLLYVQLLSRSKTSAAQDVLLQGLRYHPDDPRYQRIVFGFMLQRLEDDHVVAIARDILADRTRSNATLHLAAHAAATACYLRGNYDTADAFLERVPGLLATKEAQLLAAKIEWERGFFELALAELRRLSTSFPADTEVHGELLRRVRQLGRRDEARRLAVAFQIAHPKSIPARLDLLRAYHEDRNRARLGREMDALLRDFEGDAAALAQIGDFAAGIGDVQLTRRIADEAQRRNHAFEPHAFLIIEAHIVARNYSGAFAAMDRLSSENPAWAQQYQSLLDSLRAVASLGLGDIEASQLFLANFLQRPAVRADNLLALANRFVALDASEQARQVLVRAVAADSLNQAALTRLIELELNLNRIDELPSRLRQLLTMRKPSPDLLRVAQHKLGSDLFLFSSDRAATLDAIAAALERDRRSAARITAQFRAAP